MQNSTNEPALGVLVKTRVFEACAGFSCLRLEKDILPMCQNCSLVGLGRSPNAVLRLIIGHSSWLASYVSLLLLKKDFPVSLDKAP